MRYLCKMFLLLVLCLFFIACSDESNNGNTDSKKDHVWKEQTDTINAAKEVEGMILDSAKQTRKTIEQQSE